MSDSDVFLTYASSTESLDTSYSSRFSPTKENCVLLDGFSRAVFRSRLEEKTPVTECLVCCVCVLFSMMKSMLRMGSCVRFCWHNILFLRAKRREGSPGQCSRVSLLLSSKIAKAEAVVVEPVKRKMSEFVLFKLTSNKAFNWENLF